jgi:hypothetical protein
MKLGVASRRLGGGITATASAEMRLLDWLKDASTRNNATNREP